MNRMIIAQARETFESASGRVPLLCIVGPTASGKSRLAVDLAKECNGEVVSCDSMQVYRRMDIGTAKPTARETDGVPHHMIDIVEPTMPYSCSDYAAEAKRVICDIDRRGRLPILCGGTGLYLDRLLHGGTDYRAASSPQVRAELADYCERYGKKALHERLRQVDPICAEAVHENNVPRVIRALEIWYVTGKTKTESDKLCAEPDPTFCPYVAGLAWERDLLNRRIDRRVDEMLAAGLIAETKRLLDEGVFACNATAAQAIGYKELFAYLRGEESLDAATERLKTATHQYAKRQMTWFRAKPYVHWFEQNA